MPILSGRDSRDVRDLSSDVDGLSVDGKTSCEYNTPNVGFISNEALRPDCCHWDCANFHRCLLPCA